MKNSIWAALSGLAVVAAIPAYATNSNFNFTTGSSNSNLSSYSATAGGITATATALYSDGNATQGPTGNLQKGEVGLYQGDGLGICENQNNGNCNSPNHQVDNAVNGGSSQNFEFMLIQFSTAVNLNQIQLGNFGTTGSSSADPFLTTYFTSSSNASLASVEQALGATTVGGVTGTDGFSAAQAGSCSTGQSSLGAGSSNYGYYNDTCKVNGNGVASLNGTDVTYLLIGASTAKANIGNGFFKIQDLTASPYQSTGGTSPTPEPATFGLLGSALLGLGFTARKRKRS